MELYSQKPGTKFGWYQEERILDIVTNQPTKKRATLAEYTQNGKYCLEGLAFQVDTNEAQCTLTNAIKFDGKVANAPYNCTATDPNKKCQIVYEQGTPQEDHVEVFCRCSMSK